LVKTETTASTSRAIAMNAEYELVLIEHELVFGASE
jgi:hypothetical protein